MPFYLAYGHESCATDEEAHTIVGNGYCNDETNIANCNYDGGDCCLSNPNTEQCSECRCFTTGVITSPGFPRSYDVNLDLSWDLQVPSGLYIKMKFIAFDVRRRQSGKW